MLGKRFHRTTSMAQIGPACSIKPQAAPPDSDYQPITQWEILKQAEELMKKMMAAAGAGGAKTDSVRPAGTGSTSGGGGGSSTSADTAAPLRSPPDFIPRGTFLDTCFFCKRRLKHERDIFIYRGDAAFCTEECRQRHILNGESSMTASNKKGGPSSEAAVAA